MAVFASQVLANSRVARFEGVIRHPGLLHAVDIHRNHIAEDGRLDDVPGVQAIIGAALVSQVSEFSKRTVPPDNLDVG